MFLFKTPPSFLKFFRWFFAAAIAAAVDALAQLPTATVLPAAAAPGRETRAQKVELLRDGSVEESLSRKIDAGFGSVRIDGEKSSVPLSSLTADQVLAAETTKVPTPDLDADAVGGLLQLTSRRTFGQEAPTLRASLAADYNALTDRFNPEGSMTYGRAFGGGRFGFVTTVSGERRSRHEEQIDTDWDSATAGGLLEGVALQDNYSTASEFAFNGLLDWKVGENTAAQFRMNFQRERERETQRDVAYRLDDRRQPATSTSRIERSLNDEEQRSTSFTVAASLAHKAERWELDGRLSHTLDRGETPDDRQYKFRQERVGIDYTIDDPRFPGVTARAGARPDDAAQFFLNELQRRHQEERESDSVASLDWKVRELGGWKTAWTKVGAKYRALRSDHVEANDVFGATGGGLALGEVLDSARNDDFAGGRYALHTFPSASALRELFAAQPGRFALDVNATRSDTDPASYEVQQDVLATYAMASVALGRHTRLLAGARMERTENTFTGYEVLFDSLGDYEATNRLGATNSYTNWFPGVHLTRALTPTLDLFVSWAQSIRRPDYNRLVPARRVNRSSAELREGNPSLRPTLYTNIDLALEWAYHRSGRLALEGFHRDVADTLVERRERLAGGAYDGYERRRPENGGGASLRGFEVKWRQELEGLGDAFAGFGVEANYTFTDSVQEVANRPGEKIPLGDLPKHELTVQLAYERGDFYGSVELNHQSDRLDSVGGGRSDDRFNPARTRWDLSLSYALNERWRFFLEGENLTQEPDRSFEGDPRRVEDYSLEPREFRFGVKWEM
ncbi:MAG: TonB-dependent receptor [Opitutaceae bacterium]